MNFVFVPGLRSADIHRLRSKSGMAEVFHAAGVPHPELIRVCDSFQVAEHSMSRVSFLYHPTIGHLNTLLSMALRMRAEGHQPCFILPSGAAPSFRWMPEVLKTVREVAATVEHQGLPVERLRMPLGVLVPALRLASTMGYEELRLALKIFTAGMAPQARHVVRLLEGQPVDVVVTDFAFFPAALAAERLGLPWVSVYRSGLPFRGPGVSPLGSGLPLSMPPGPELQRAEADEAQVLAWLHRRGEAARRALGLGPGPEDLLCTPLSPWLNPVTSHEAIEAPRTGLGPSCFFIGPCFSTRRGGDTGLPRVRLHGHRLQHPAGGVPHAASGVGHAGGAGGGERRGLLRATGLGAAAGQCAALSPGAAGGVAVTGGPGHRPRATTAPTRRWRRAGRCWWCRWGASSRTTGGGWSTWVPG